MKLKKWTIAIALLGSSGCTENPMTFAVHNPIYPEANQAVTYNLEKVSGSNITSAELYQTVATIDTSGSVTSTGSETLLQQWSSPANSINHTKQTGYPSNSLVTYRWVVEAPAEDG